MRTGAAIITAANDPYYGAIEYWHASFVRTGLSLVIYDIGLSHRNRAQLVSKGMTVISYDTPNAMRVGLVSLKAVKPLVIEHFVENSQYAKVIWTDVDMLYVSTSIDPVLNRLLTDPFLIAERLPTGVGFRVGVSTGIVGFDAERPLDRRVLRNWAESTNRKLAVAASPARTKCLVDADWILSAVAQAGAFESIQNTDEDSNLSVYSRWDYRVSSLPTGRGTDLVKTCTETYGKDADVIHSVRGTHERKYWNYLRCDVRVVGGTAYDIEQGADGYFRWISSGLVLQTFNARRVRFTFASTAHAAQQLTLAVGNAEAHVYTFTDNRLAIELELQADTTITIGGMPHVPSQLFAGCSDGRSLLAMLTSAEAMALTSDSYADLELFNWKMFAD